jgi:hypothetical protein
MSTRTWTPNGYGLHHLAPLPTNTVVAVEDHLTHAIGFVRWPFAGLSETRTTHADVDQAKAWCEEQVAALEQGA